VSRNQERGLKYKLDTQVQTTELLKQKYKEVQRRTSIRESSVSEWSYNTTAQCDAAQAVTGREVTLLLLSHEMEQLAEMDHAIEWYSKGYFGLCEGCGQPINPERLIAKLGATRCVACQSAWDRSRNSRIGRC